MNHSNVQPLFRPVTIGNLSLSNRIVMAPMTRAVSTNGVLRPDVAAYYRRRAENGVGLIITEGSFINHPVASGGPMLPDFHGEAALNEWEKVVSEVHDAGGKIIVQLWHEGTERKNGTMPHPELPSIGPSGVNAAGEKVNEPMTEADIAAVIEAYAQAAAEAKRLGFDGIELHAAHGYLIDQFFWAKTNRRTDRYGGDIVARTRFAVEVVEACRLAVGPDYPIVLRISQWKTAMYDAKLVENPAELGKFLSPLVEAGVDIFHCSTRRFWEPEFAGSELNLAAWTKKLSGKPVITVGSVGLDSQFMSPFEDGDSAKNVNIDGLIERVEQGEFDLVAVGRALLADPEWAIKIRDGRTDELRPFTAESAKTLY